MSLNVPSITSSEPWNNLGLKVWFTVSSHFLVPRDGAYISPWYIHYDPVFHMISSSNQVTIIFTFKKKIWDVFIVFKFIAERMKCTLMLHSLHYYFFIIVQSYIWPYVHKNNFLLITGVFSVLFYKCEQ